jgi:formylglycine-generating enzyme required for sulfatase activity
MSGYRQWTDPLLREESARAAAGSRQKLHTSLALLPADAGQVDYLSGRLLDARPQEVPVIREALAPHKGALREKLWAVAEAPEKGKESQRLRAAAALAKYDPEGERWPKVREAVTNDLVTVPAVYLVVWMESLRPVRVKLLPALLKAYRDAKRRDVERSLATDILADYAADRPAVLADLLMDAHDKQFAVIYPKFKEQGEQGLPILIGEIDKKLPSELPSSDGKRETLAKRQANAAVALQRMNQAEKVWPLLKHSSDPRVRSYLIHRLSPLGADAGAIIQRFDEERDITVRRAMLLSLGEYGEKDLPPDAREALLPKLQGIYRTASDPGLHAAAEWLLRTWKQEPWLKQVTGEWAKDKERRAKRLSAIQQFVQKNKEKTPPQWFVNCQGQTMVVISGPVEFFMGSPTTEANRRAAEVLHQRRIARAFALAATPVTKEQFLRYSPTFTHREFNCYPEPTCPIGGVTWYEAATYCNWLSKKEGIPENQWCYEIKGNEIRLRANYLSLNGYRLPTEAEMEYATRAGARTARYFGETEELLPRYAWYFQNSKEKTWPVGSKKPNDLGLFDVQGNVYVWCQESYRPYPQAKETTEDKEDDLMIASASSRVLRGGSFLGRASNLRSAYRDVVVPPYRGVSNGFRPARTFIP